MAQRAGSAAAAAAKALRLSAWLKENSCISPASNRRCAAPDDVVMGSE
jgi:hypothetical protein